MRPGDAPLIPVVAVPGACPTDLHVAVNVLTPLTGAPAWDDPGTRWDDGDRWRARERWVDVAADVTGLTLERSDTEAAHLTFGLRNSALRYSQTQLEFPIGGLVAVWLGTDWRFYGRITQWTEHYPTTPDEGVERLLAAVTIEAFDSVFLLDQQVDGVEYRLGLEGEATPARLGTLAATGSFQRHLKFDQSTMPHRDQRSTNPVFESMVVTAESDGGEVFIDNDGGLMYLDRQSMIVGRADHAQPFATFSDGCEAGTLSFSEGLPRTSDALIRNDVVLQNVDELEVRALDQGSISAKGRRLLTLSDQTWAAPELGAQLAADLLDRYSLATYYLDPIVVARPPFPALRIGDLVRYQRTLPSGTRIDANLRVTALGWSYGPAGEFLTVTTSPVTVFNAYTRWDDPAARWDDPETLYV